MNIDKNFFYLCCGLFFALNLQADNLGGLLLNGNCTTCHFERKTVSAPSVVDFRKKYLKAYPKKDDFVKNMISFIKNPNPKKSLMPKAIKKHELMPQIAFEEDTLSIIVKYIYDTDFSSK